MNYPDPVPGETIFCWTYGPNFIGHKHILFLGKDSAGTDKVLAPHPEEGWSIIDLDELPKGFYRPIGKYNILDSKANKNCLTEILYQFYDKGEPLKLTIKYESGIWELVKDFQMPSWVGGIDARGTGSKEDCGSDVSSLDGEGLSQDGDSDGQVY